MDAPIFFILDSSHASREELCPSTPGWRKKKERKKFSWNVKGFGEVILEKFIDGTNKGKSVKIL